MSTGDQFLISPTEATVQDSLECSINESLRYENKSGSEYPAKELEPRLLHFKKLAEDTIDQHITKFVSVIGKQSINEPYDEIKVNRFFLYTLETAQIPNEDWEGFITFLGRSWFTISTHALFTEARSYYCTSIHHTSTPPNSTTPVLADCDESEDYNSRHGRQSSIQLPKSSLCVKRQNYNPVKRVTFASPLFSISEFDGDSLDSI
jgi:hypothetical protein